MRLVGVLSFALLACGEVSVREVPPQQAQATPSCPAGSTWNGSVCAATVDTSCPAGTQFVEGRGCVAQVVQREEAPPPPPPPQGQSCPAGEQWNGVACVMPRGEWVRQLNALLPGKICALPVFQQCFRATRVECERMVAALSQSCMAERTLPPFLDDATSNREGTAIGRCIGTVYKENMKTRGRTLQGPLCDNN